MSKKIIAVNAGPRKGWNTDTLITEAAKFEQTLCNSDGTNSAFKEIWHGLL